MLGSTAAQVKLIRKYLKLKILEDNITFRGHNLERHHVYELMRKTIVNGESHSALVIGARGCGKTTLINSVLSQLSKEVDLERDAIIVRLHGLMHHDDKLALKAITAQMQLENAVGDRVFGTFAENLTFLLSCLQSGADRRCKSMVFVLEEFDMFCHTARAQTLLYNLFDVTMSGQAPMCVIGLTSRLDVMELLEKRVKSRFSHRHICLYPTEERDGKPMSPLQTFLRLLGQLLTVPVPRVAESPRKKMVPRRKSQSRIEDTKSADSEENHLDIPKEVFKRCNVDPKHFAQLDRQFVEDWNAHVQALVEEETVVDAVEKFCYYTVNEQVFRDMLFQVVSSLGPSQPYLDGGALSRATDRAVCGRRAAALRSLSALEMSLLVASEHAREARPDQPANIEMILHRYTRFANANSSTQSVPRPVILKAFEHLQALEILMPVKGTDSIYNSAETTASRVQKEYQWFMLAVPREEIDEAIKGYKGLPTEISQWYTNSIM